MVQIDSIFDMRYEIQTVSVHRVISRELMTNLHTEDLRPVTSCDTDSNDEHKTKQCVYELTVIC